MKSSQSEEKKLTCKNISLKAKSEYSQLIIKVFRFSLFVQILLSCMTNHNKHAVPSVDRIEESIEFPSAEVPNNCKPPCVHWKLNLAISRNNTCSETLSYLSFHSLCSKSRTHVYPTEITHFEKNN